MFTLYSYLRLQDEDRREQFAARMQRIEAAQLMAIAFHEPKRLDDERRSALAEARPRNADEDARARGQAMLVEMERGKVLVS